MTPLMILLLFGLVCSLCGSVRLWYALDDRNEDIIQLRQDLAVQINEGDDHTMRLRRRADYNHKLADQYKGRMERAEERFDALNAHLKALVELEVYPCDKSIH